MSSESISQQTVLPKRTGLRHVLAAGSYSLSGLRCLLRETAFRHELVLGAVLFAVLAVADASTAAFLIQAILLLALIAVEALNTAIERIVDRVSPEWSIVGKEAKDLGSFAVACLVAINLVFAGLACTGSLQAIGT